MHTHRFYASKVPAEWRKSKKVKTPATRSSGVLNSLIVKAFNQAPHMTHCQMKTRGKRKTKTTALQGNPLLWQPAQLFFFPMCFQLCKALICLMHKPRRLLTLLRRLQTLLFSPFYLTLPSAFNFFSSFDGPDTTNH